MRSTGPRHDKSSRGVDVMTWRHSFPSFRFHISLHVTDERLVQTLVKNATWKFEKNVWWNLKWGWFVTSAHTKGYCGEREGDFGWFLCCSMNSLQDCSANDATLKIRSLCHCFVHEFKSAEFHAAYCEAGDNVHETEFFRKNGQVLRGKLSVQHVP